MYQLYIWNPWDFGKWIFKGEFQTKKQTMRQIHNKREATYKIVRCGEVIEYHEAQSYCWRYGMVRPKVNKE